MQRLLRLTAICFGMLVTVAAYAEEWSRFRGPNGSGRIAEAGSVPTVWNDTENLKWKSPLPGPGASCPIVFGERIFVTCWTGYAVDRRDSGDLESLKRHLICLDRASGKILWNQSVAAALPEDRFQGMFAENGYATHTPVCDGKRVVAFFGKSGVVAFDLEGNQLWTTQVGDDLDTRGWGSASSPIIYQNLVIVTAAIENHALVALDVATGKEVWKTEAEGLESTWGTPILVDREDGKTDLVLSVPYEIWGLNPETGKLRWYCEAIESSSMCSSVVAADGVIYAVERGPRGGGAIAVRAGGKGDVTDTHVVWTTSDRSRVGTPVVAEGRIHWVSNKIATCVDAHTGERIYQERLAAGNSRVAEPASEAGGQRGRRRGGRGGQDYASPIVANGFLYYVTRNGQGFVVKLGEKFEQTATNAFGDGGEFSATPAISNGALFLRSDKFLYCVSSE